MKKAFFIHMAALLFLAACAGVDTYHSACADAHATIAGQVACVKANIAQSQASAGDTLAQEYVRTGEVLASQVAQGTLSEAEAQLKFVQALNRLKQDSLRAQAYQAQIDRASRDKWPRHTDCQHRGDGSLSCTSY